MGRKLSLRGRLRKNSWRERERGGSKKPREARGARRMSKRDQQCHVAKKNSFNFCDYFVILRYHLEEEMEGYLFKWIWDNWLTNWKNVSLYLMPYAK